jgi:hypothetical protein
MIAALRSCKIPEESATLEPADFLGFEKRGGRRLLERSRILTGESAVSETVVTSNRALIQGTV